jgi:hypothetical protein
VLACCADGLACASCRNPLGCGIKEPLPERWKAKQFGVVAPRTDRTIDTYFEKKFSYLAENDK